VILAVADLTLEARVLAVSITRLTLVRFGFQNLARSLMLKLIIFTEVIGAE
jgi:hypothetical protein